MHSDVRLRAPIELSGDDVEEALFEQTLDEAAVARAFGRLRGAAAERAAQELNHALKVDILDILAQGWSQVPPVRSAVERTALTQGPPAIINLDRHTIASTARVVLDTHVAQSALPPLHPEVWLPWQQLGSLEVAEQVVVVLGATQLRPLQEPPT